MANDKVLVNVFVYGTLKRGKRNHAYFTQHLEAKFVSSCNVDGYALYYAGVPMAIPCDYSVIYGELYTVPKEHMKRLDRFETGYKKVVVEVKPYLTEAYMYILDVERIPNGNY